MTKLLAAIAGVFAILAGVFKYRLTDLKRQNAEDKLKAARKVQHIKDSVAQAVIEGTAQRDKEIEDVKNSDIDLDHFNNNGLHKD